MSHLVLELALWVLLAFFVGCIIAIPILGFTRRYGYAGLLVGVVLGEVLVLIVNRWQCPLTGVAARYTNARDDNFDIYLPVWVARHNKVIFGILFLGGTLFTLARWAGWIG